MNKQTIFYHITMVKPSKNNTPGKHSQNNGDGHSPASTSNTPRTLRSNAAVSQIFIASTGASTSTTNLSTPLTMSSLPYSTVQTSLISAPPTLALNSIQRKVDPLRSPMVSGASLLSQDFFMKGVGSEDIKKTPPKESQDRFETVLNNNNNNITNNNNSINTDVNTCHKQTHNITDHSSSSLDPLTITPVSGERNFSTKDSQSFREGASDIRANFNKFSKRASSFRNNFDEAGQTRDLIRDLKSLIFDQNDGSQKTDLANHSKSINLSSDNQLDCSTNSIRDDSLLLMNDFSRFTSSNDESSVTTNDNLVLRNANENSPKSPPSCDKPFDVEPISKNNSNHYFTASISGDPVPGPSTQHDGTFHASDFVQDSTLEQPVPSTSFGNPIAYAQKSEKKPIRSSRRSRKSSQDNRYATVSKLPSISSTLTNLQQQLQDINMDLPPRWQACLDAHGRVFYIDHERRTTTWHRPKSKVITSNSNMPIKVPASKMIGIEVCDRSPESETGLQENNTPHVPSKSFREDDSTEQQRALLNRRYTLRRTISSRRPSKTFPEEQTESPLFKDQLHSQDTCLSETSDAIDGNCMSGPSTSRAISYNSCVEQNSQPVPSTSSQTRSPTYNITDRDPTTAIQLDQTTIQPTSEDNVTQPTQAFRASHQLSPAIQCPAALKFLNRSDFLNLLHLNDEALMLYNTSTYLKVIINRVRKDKTDSAFERYQHNKELVAFLNKFAAKTEPLPSNWEIKECENGKSIFIDHARKATTYIDPRLPTEVPLINPRRMPLYDHRTPASVASANCSSLEPTSPVEIIPSASARAGCSADQAPIVTTSETSLESSSNISQDPAGASSSTQLDVLVASTSTSHSTSVGYEEKIVAFFKQPNIFDLIKDRRSASSLMNATLRDRINQIRKGGIAVLKKYSHDVNLMMLISLFDIEIDTINTRTSSSRPIHVAQPRNAIGRIIVPGKGDFEAKLRYFYKKLEQKNYGQGPNKLKLGIRRDHILEDAFTKVMSVNSKKDLQRSRLYVSFAGEDGLDYGGPSREFFFLLSRELFNPYYGLFEYSANDTYTVQISPMSSFVDNFNDWFRFSGRMLGLALIHQYLLDAFFTRPFYKALLKLPCSLSDLEYLDAEFHQSLQWVKDSDISDLDLDLTFSVVEEVAGKVVEKELKPGGRNIPVTEKNKRDYIDKMVKWRLERGVSGQTDSLVKGFYEVIDPRLVSVFDARELELVIAGTAEIDVKDWRKNTDYRGGYYDSHVIIQWFWIVIEQKFDNDQRLRLLQFVTGTSSIPYEGFEALRGSNGPRKFCIEKWGKPTSLPRAHTCFNRLDLPSYSSFELLHEKLLLAVEESSTFGIE